MLALPARAVTHETTHTVRAEVAATLRRMETAFLHRDSVPLCASFTSSVARQLVHRSSVDHGCVMSVRNVIAATSSLEPIPPRFYNATVGRVTWKGSRARATLMDGSRHAGVVFFRRIANRWRISTPTHIVLVPGCGSRPFARGCPIGSKLMVLIVNWHFANLSVLRVATPPNVQHAGKRELQEFDRGKAIALALGCAACHRIGESGNHGPGPTLTYVGSKLTEREIRRVLLSPRAPMPSFRGVPRHKLRALIKFLALLRSPTAQHSADSVGRRNSLL